MKTVTKTALANVKQNKGRNFLCGCAIALTTFLIFVVLTVGYGMIRVQLASVDAYYPTYHIMFRQVSEKNTKALQVHNDIEEIGLRMDLGQIIDDDATIIMTAMDNNGIRLNKAELEEGTFPKNEKDIVVSKGVLEELGIQGKLGDEITIPYQIYEKDGMGYAKEDTFRICGFMESSDLNKEKKMYFVMNSMEYAKQMIPEADREYRVMFRLADAEHMTTDEIEERGKEIGEDFGVPEGNVVENREYLVANYTDPSFIKGMIVVIVMVVLAGILTIYSIYYVSMIPKVQEYGKLKAIGSTKRQIRQMVFREGMLVTALALPVGLLISSFLSRWIMKQMITFMAGEDPLMQVAAELVKNGEVSLLHWWIYAITIMAVLFTSAVSLAKPMRIAAKVSPIEAMRYQGLEKRGKKVRKGYQNLTIFRLTKANMARNKKRTGITIVTLGATGILFMVVATILSCAAPKEIARKDIESDYKIELETWGGDKMNPDRDWRQVQQNNPLTKAFIDQVRDVDGVEEVKVKTFMNGEIPKLSMDGEIWGADIIGLDASYAETLEKGEIQGHVTYEELEKGDKILMSANMLYWFPELKVGDSLKMVLNMGDDQVEKTFEIGAIGDYYESLGGSSFYLPQSVLEKMNPNNLNYTLEITVNDQKKNSAPKGLTSASGIDVMTHALEAYVSMMASDYTDGLALRAIKLVFDYLPRAYRNGNDVEARDHMANASCMAGMAFANAFLGVNHSLAHKLGAFHHIPHGIANALVLTDVMRYNAAEVPAKMGTFPQYQYPKTLARYAEVGRFVGLTGKDDKEVFEKLLDKLEELKKIIEIKPTIKDYGVDEKYFLETLDEMSEQAFNDQCTGANPRYPLIAELKEIYLKAYYGK